MNGKILTILLVVLVNVVYGQMYKLSVVDIPELSKGNVESIIEDKTGNVWFIANNDIVRYNGEDYKVFADAGLVKARYNGIFCDSKNRIWVGNAGGSKKGLSVFENGKWKTYTESDGIAKSKGGFKSKTIFAEDKFGNIWFTYSNSESVSKFDNEKWTYYEGDFADDPVDIVCLDNGHVIAYNGKGTVSFFVEDMWVSFIAFFPEPTFKVVDENTSYLTSKGDVYVAKLNYTEPKVYIPQTLPSSTKASDVLIRDKAVFFATNKGFVVFNGKWKQYTENEGLASVKVNALLAADDGAIWLGTNKGASKFADNIITNYSKSEGLQNKDIERIYEDAKSNIWLVSKKEVSKYDGKSFKLYTETEEYGEDFGEIICDDQAAGLKTLFYTFIGAKPDKLGMNLYNGRAWEVAMMPSYNMYVQDYNNYMKDSKGATWIGTEFCGVAMFDGFNWYTFTDKEDGLPNMKANYIFVDSKDRVWVRTERGMAVISE